MNAKVINAEEEMNAGMGEDFAPDVSIAVKDLNVFYGKRKVVHNISMNILKGKVTALIGPSGCGKSTFLRTLNRMNDLIPTARVEGEVRIFGRNIYESGFSQSDISELRKRVGMVFQRSNPFPKSIYENVAWGLRIHGVRDRSRLRSLVREALSKAHLWHEVSDRLNTSALALSGGQQQRLCIARALAIQPEIILMDEPASALDPKGTAKLEELIHDLKGQYTIVIVTHNMQQAARVSDFTAFFYDGCLIEYDRTDKIFTNPQEKMTEEYITGRFG